MHLKFQQGFYSLETPIKKFSQHILILFVVEYSDMFLIHFYTSYTKNMFRLKMVPNNTTIKRKNGLTAPHHN